MNIAILIPCHNEEKTVGLVVDSFKRFMPESTIYVYDNLSLDKTAEVAKKSGAIVRSEINKGKGNVMRRMFADIESDIYIIVDGDNTYDASMSVEMVDYLIKNKLDMVVGSRKTSNSGGEYRRGHVFGNWMLTKSVALILAMDLLICFLVIESCLDVL
jgi:glycosyltransferase involved in cell wall biosynthesis